MARHNPIGSFSGRINIDRKKLIGNGNFATVYAGIYGEQPIAVKRILVENVSIYQERDLKLQSTLDHENVLKVLTVEQDTDFRYYKIYNNI